MTVPNWKHLVAEKQAQQANQLPQAWRISPSLLQEISPQSQINVLDIPRQSGLLSTEELDLTEKYDAVDLVQKMANKEVSAYAVVLAFCKRAAIAQQVVRTYVAFQGPVGINYGRRIV
jgi:amidase